MKDIRLNVITPESTLVDEMVDNVTLPGSVCPFQVLKNHAALISSLDNGTIKYVIDGEPHDLAIKSGFAEVCDNVVTACVEI